MKPTSITLLLFLCCACHSSKNTIICRAVDMATLDSIAPKSYLLPEGQTLYMTTSSYDYIFPDMNILKKKKSADFVHLDRDLKLSGSSSSVAKVDTLIQSQYLVTSTLQTAYKKGDTRKGKVYIGSDEYRNPDNTLNIQQITNDYHPDVWIDLSAFSIQVSGERQSGGSAYNSPFVVMTNAAYESGGVYGNSSGNIIMRYTALWKITDTRTGAIKDIKLEGTVKRKLGQGFELIPSLNECAVQAGIDFSNLIVR